MMTTTVTTIQGSQAFTMPGRPAIDRPEGGISRTAYAGFGRGFQYCKKNKVTMSEPSDEKTSVRLY